MRNTNTLRALFLAGAMAFAPAAASAQSASDMAAMRAQLEAQSAEIEALRAQMDAQTDILAKASKDATALGKSKPAFKAAPEFKDGEWKFKVRGRFMYDVGYASNPNDLVGCPSACTTDLGFSTRVRRARLGVEGEMPGGFGYKAEVDLASGSAAWADLFLEYKINKTLSAKIGHQNTFQSLEQPSSSRHLTFMERPQFVEAYGQDRRLGGSLTYGDGNVYFGAGIFNEGLNETVSGTGNNGWLFGARAAFAPKFGDVQAHLGANYQHREYNSSSLGARYRARPNPRMTSVRFVDTSTIAAEADDQFGLEAAAIFGPLHVVGEASWMMTKAINASDLNPGNVIPSGAIIANGDPKMFGYYLEAGYFFTGETRGYKATSAEWDRTKVKNPVGKGGIGAISGNVRWDSLDLNDDALQVAGTGTSGTNTSRGGRSNALSLSLVWQPIDFVRVTTQYTNLDVNGGPQARSVNGAASSVNATDLDYKVDVFGMRFAFDF